MLPHGQGSSPGGEEQADDDEADGVQVQAADPVPERAVQAGLVGEQAQQLGGADDQRDGDGQAGNGEVVVDLPYRLGKGPAVGEVHERTVDGVQQAHAGREKDRQAEDGVPGQAGGGSGAGQHQQSDRAKPGSDGSSDAVSTSYAALVETVQVRSAQAVGIWGVGGVGAHAVRRVVLVRPPPESPC